jgi:hypothetical protein
MTEIADANKKITKTALVREVLGQNPHAKPREIVESLAHRGVKISSAVVSQIKIKIKHRAVERTEDSADADPAIEFIKHVTKIGLTKAKSIVDAMSAMGNCTGVSTEAICVDPPKSPTNSTPKRTSLARAMLSLRIVEYLRRHGATTSVVLSEQIAVPRATLALALKDLRERGVVQSSQGSRDGVSLILGREELTCGRVLGRVPFVEPQMLISDLVQRVSCPAVTAG